MAKPRPLPPIDYLRECLDYDAETGAFRWRQRPVAHFNRLRDALGWNARFEGREAGRLTKFGYRQVRLTIGSECYSLYLHRVALLLISGEEPADVDHVNGDRSDNRAANLRPATRQQNLRNSARRRRLPKGVHVDQERGGYIASATIDRKRRFIGRYADIAAAHAAYCSFVAPIYGEYFRAG